MNPTKNPMPFYRLEDNVWTNFKPLWHANSSYCTNSDKLTQVYYPGVHHFQLLIDEAVLISEVDIRDYSDNTVVIGLTFNTKVFYDGDGNRFMTINVNLISALIGGKYYISVDTTTGKFYSEVFCVDNNRKDKIGIAYAANCKTGMMVYPSGYYHTINLDARLITGDVTIDEEIEENGLGDETKTLQRMVQKYTLSAIVPTYLAEAISAMAMHNSFRFMDYFDNQPYLAGFDGDIIGVETASEPEETGCNSVVTITFSKKAIIKTACCDELFEDVFADPAFKYFIYDEGEELEYTEEVNSIDMLSEEDANTGNKSIKFTDALNWHNIFFDSPITIPAAGNKLNIAIKPEDPNYFSLVISLGSNSESTQRLTLSNGSYGLDISQNVWQEIEIPLSDFNITQFQRIYLYPGGDDQKQSNYSLDTMFIDKI